VQGKTYTKEKLDKLSKRSKVKYTEEQYKIYETIGGTPFLDGGYTVYGEVIEGLDVIDKIAAVATDKANRPIEDVQMTMKIVKR